MTAERELLEKAAKAAGITLEWWDAGCPGYFSDIGDRGAGVQFTNWNPLTDDGDALRLAVKLGLRITYYPVYDKPKHAVIVDKPCGADFDTNTADRCSDVVELFGDPCAATRRAIVRAAAALGEHRDRA